MVQESNEDNQFNKNLGVHKVLGEVHKQKYLENLTKHIQTQKFFQNQRLKKS